VNRKERMDRCVFHRKIGLRIKTFRDRVSALALQGQSVSRPIIKLNQKD